MGCDDVTPSCFPNKQTNKAPPLGCGFPWPHSHALSLELTVAPADTRTQQRDNHLICLWGLILVFSFPVPWRPSLRGRMTRGCGAACSSSTSEITNSSISAGSAIPLLDPISWVCHWAGSKLGRDGKLCTNPESVSSLREDFAG